jgi:hypothetical protein
VLTCLQVEVSYAILGELLEALAADWRAHTPNGAWRRWLHFPVFRTHTQQQLTHARTRAPRSRLQTRPPPRLRRCVCWAAWLALGGSRSPCAC